MAGSSNKRRVSEMNAVLHDLDDYRTLTPALPGRNLSWLNRLREEAQENFLASGFPTPREEEWKYTNIAPIEKKRFKAVSLSMAGEVDMATISAYRLQDAWSLVFMDGIYAHDLSVTEGLPKNVWVMSMAEALERHPEMVEALLQKAAARENHGLIALTTAWFRDGALILIPAGMVLTKPIQIIHFATCDEGLSITRNLIALENHAEVQVIETYAGVPGLSYLTAAITEINVGRNAGLSHYKWQTETAKAYHFGGIYADQSPSARFYQHHVAIGALVSRTEIHSELDQAAECQLTGLFLCNEQRHLDAHTLIRHLAAHGISRVNYRGIASDRARGVFSGRIIVHPEARKTDAEMNNRNLLLSREAEIDSKPQLEIHADDVKCTHGVTVGQLDPNSVFYLESRGVDEASARHLLTYAFANEIVEEIRLESLKSRMQNELLSFNFGVR